ncbi:SapC family protein [Sphingomonas piscis]|uniref:SapC family protein n=1 Tax=Sphingomonas piscis TaxID=2714943 RepID=A0A6G7YLY2_9SPHN|nr:SapC family protein [Sphingomonas piscis]QIK77748.1 SapC family protein [Sphingomonas piscis]
MANRVPLDNVAHANLRAAVRRGADFGDAVNQTLVVPTEFESVQREYPIFIRKDAEGQWVAVALLGLDRGENLFLEGDRWQARYIPAVHRRGPFFLGIRGDGEARELAVHVDLDDPRIGETEGEPLFREHGGDSPYLDHVTQALHLIHEGLAAGRGFYAALERMGLLQPVELDADVGDGKTYAITGLFTVGMQQFQSLGAAQLEELHRAGYLAPLIFIRASLPNMNHLIDIKKRRIGQG